METRAAAGDTGIGQGHSGHGSCSTAALQHGWSRCSLATALVMGIWGGNCRLQAAHQVDITSPVISEIRQGYVTNLSKT